MQDWRFETRAIHSGFEPAEHGGATSVPIYQTAAFAYETAQELAEVFEGRSYGHVYSRISNPTVAAFERRMAALEGGIGAVATASGMAAITTVLLALCGPGEEVVSSPGLFGGTLTLLNRLFRRYGVHTRYVDPLDLPALEAALSERTRLVFVESLGNPGLDVPDLGRIAALASRRRVPVVVDSTLTTPYLSPAREHGASLVVHSSTKYISGSGNSIGGVLVDTGLFDWSAVQNPELQVAAGRVGAEMAFLSLARRLVVQHTGSILSPFNAYLHCLGLETLALRMERHCSNALALAEFLQSHPGVEAVRYPGLKGDRGFEAATRQLGGRYGALLTARLGSRERCFRLIDRLRLASNLANLGDAKTLVIHPASTIYHDCTREEMVRAGVSDDLIRISVGIENPQDIIEDFRQALDGLEEMKR